MVSLDQLIVQMGLIVQDPLYWAFAIVALVTAVKWTSISVLVAEIVAAILAGIGVDTHVYWHSFPPKIEIAVTHVQLSATLILGLAIGTVLAGVIWAVRSWQ